VLRPSIVASDNLEFTGQDGERSQQIAMALTALQPELAARVHIVPGVEVRSTGDLSLTSDWNLMPSGAVRVTAPTALTLRAAGDLTIANSLSDGFVAVAGASDRNAIAANGVAQTEGASYRLVGGADLSAADPLGVRTDGLGNVTIGRSASRTGIPPPSVFVRTTTGSIDVAAAGDIRQQNSQARVYTTGTPVGQAGLAQFNRFVFSVNQLARGSSTGSFSGPFFEHAGDITLQAGRDLLGSPGTTYNASGNVVATQYVTDWWYRQTGTTSAEQPVALWSRYDLFGQGFASFGGGDIRVSAGRDVVDLEVSTPTTGYRIGARRDADGQTVAAAGERWFDGGTLNVVAGRNVVSGLYNAGGPTARLVAGSGIVPAANTGLGQSQPVTQVLYQSTDWEIRAALSLTVSSLTNPGLLGGAAQGSEVSPRSDLVDGVAAGARATLSNLAGDVTISSTRPSVGANDRRFSSPGSSISPDELRVTAVGGAISLGALVQRPTGDAELTLLAAADAKVETLKLTGGNGATAPRPQAQADLAALLDPINGRWNAVSDSDAGPVHIVSATGDVLFGNGSESFSARPLHLVALRDVLIDSSLRMQHEPATGDGKASPLTQLQAGRDVRFSSNASLRLGGPGDLLMVAGRDVSLGGGPGIVTVGNQDNPRGLPAGGASVTVLAGVGLAADYAQAAAGQFHLLGGGLQNFSSELAVQIDALSRGTPLLAAQALRDAVKAFDAQPLETRRARVREIVGAESFDRGVADYVDEALAHIDALGLASAALQPSGSATPVPGSQFLGQTSGPGGVPLDAAQVRAALREALSTQAFGDLLAQHLSTAAFDDATRSALTLAISPYANSLIDYMQRQGLASLSAAEAASRFTTLAPERQTLFLNQVLFQELRSAGRAATQGDRVAYLRGYDAMEALFPGSRSSGGINLSSSQIKTQQSGDVRLLTPGGGINVGELGSSGLGRSASELGLVSVAGGNIEAAVRDNLDVNQSRVFTLARGDILLWSGLGNLDAGRGAKTVTGSPPPLFTINDRGQLVVDTSGSFSGSGIAVLDAGSSLDLYAPLGEINAGDAGIQSRGTTFLGASQIVNADALALSGPTIGAPPPAPTSSANASAATAAQAAAGSSVRSTDEETEEEKRRKRRARRTLLLDFLGFGEKS